MNVKKNIDKLFQEQFNNYEELPPSIVWDNIEAKLKEKRKRKIIPFWWKLSGIAALLVISLGVYNWQFNRNEIKIDANPTVNQEKIKLKKVEDNIEVNDISNQNNRNEIEKRLVIDKTISPSDKKDNITDLATISNGSNNNGNVKTPNTLERSYIKENKKKTNQPSVSEITNDLNKDIAKNYIKSNSEIEEKLEGTKQIISSEIDFNKENKASTIANKEINNNNDKNLLNQNAISKNEKSIVNEIITDLIKMDSTKVAIVEPNSMEELLKEKEKEKEVRKNESKLNRWQLMPNVAPIYFSSTSKGSPLDPQLKNNTKDFSTTYSYGMLVNYTLSKKVKLRSGVNVFSTGYSTNGISFEQTSKASRMENVTPNLQGAFIQIKPVGSIPNMVYSRSSLAQNETILANTTIYDGSINQQLGYFELPLELSYKIIDKKIGLEFIGGMSTLFLNQNEISLTSDAMTMKIGEANNLNSIHFSGNLGLGLKYSFWKKIDAKIEPIFKYQFNTFSNDVGNFKPYIFGIYSGLSYSF